MSSYLSNLLTHTTSRYNSLRRTLLSSEEDGDTEDDTHICRVLRAYYVEKGRQFPQWLPPDPNDRKSISSQPPGQSGYFTNTGGKSAYGAVQNAQNPPQRGSLSDLWDPPASSQQQQPMQPQSLRNARRPMNGSVPPGGAGLAPPQARPLPSQRAGSYQTMGAQNAVEGRRPSHDSLASSGTAGGSGTAQDRLKARLWGAARQSPPASQVGAPNPYDQSAAAHGAAPQRGGGGQNYGGSNNGNSYDTAGGRSGGQRYGR